MIRRLIYSRQKYFEQAQRRVEDWDDAATAIPWFV